MTKRVFSLLMALALCLSLLPAPAWAAGTDTPSATEEQAATYDGTSYATLAAAVDAAKASGGTVTLAKDIAENITVDDGTVTIDLGGHRWIAVAVSGEDGEAPLTVNEGGTVTLQNGTLDQGLSGHSGSAAVFVDGGRLTVGAAMTLIGGRTWVKGDYFHAIRWGDGQPGDLTLRIGTVLTHGMYSTACKLAYALPENAAFAVGGQIIDGYTTEVSDDLTVVAHTHNIENGKCVCGLSCKHESGFDEDGKCKDCGAAAVAQIGDTFYGGLFDAINAVQENGTITLLKDANLEDEVDDDDDMSCFAKTYTLDLNGHSLDELPVGDYELDEDTSEISSPTPGNTTVTDSSESKTGYLTLLYVQCGSVTIEGGTIGTADKDDEQSNGIIANMFPVQVIINGGTVNQLIVYPNFDDDDPTVVNIKGGTNHSGTWKIGTGTVNVNCDLQLDGRLCIDGDATLGTKLTQGTFAGIAVLHDTLNGTTGNYETVNDLLADGYAYYATTEGKTGFVRGNVDSIDQTVTIRPHTCVKDNMAKNANGEYYCTACGRVCKHAHMTNGRCDLCGIECPHAHVTEENGVYTCDTCNTAMSAMRQNGDTVRYFAPATFEGSGDLDYALQNAINGVQEDGSDCVQDGDTITLLADNLAAGGTLSGKKTVTLNLNGHSLVERDNPISVQGGATLRVTGRGSSTANPDESAYRFCEVSYDSTLDLSAWEGGKLLTVRVYGSGKVIPSTHEGTEIGTLEVESGGTNLQLTRGKFGSIRATGNPFGCSSLLAEGYALQYDDGTYVPYGTTFTSSEGIEKPVTVVACPHGSITDGVCDHCGKSGIAAIYTAADGAVTVYTDAQAYEALTALGNGGTLKLLADCWSYSDEPVAVQSGKTATIDLNGYTFSSTLLAAENGASLTVKNTGTNKNAYFYRVAVVAGGALTVANGAYIEEIHVQKDAQLTLQESAKFKWLDLQDSNMLIADLLPMGYYIAQGSNSNVLSPMDNGVHSVVACEVKKVPATITAPATKTGVLSYGDPVPEDLLPTVKMNEGAAAANLGYDWYCKIGDHWQKVSSTEQNDKGQWESYIIYHLLTIGETYDAICIPNSFANNGPSFWQTPVLGYKLTIQAADLAKAEVTVTESNWNPVFTGSDITLPFTVIYDGEELTGGTHYTVESGAKGRNAGEYMLVLKGKGNFTGTLEYKWSIQPRPLYMPSVDDVSKTYDGTDALPGDFTENSFYGNFFTSPTFYVDYETTQLPGSAYTFTGHFDSATVGRNKSLVLTVTLTDENYVFSTGDRTQTFQIEGDSSWSCSIAQAAGPVQTEAGSLSITKGLKKTYTYDVSQLLPTLPDGQEYGSLSYSLDHFEIDPIYYDDHNPLKINGSTLTLPIGEYASTGEGKVGDIVIRVSSTNYEDFGLSLQINAQNKLLPEGTPILSSTTLEYGHPLSELTVSGTMTCDGKEVPGTFTLEKTADWDAPSGWTGEGEYTPDVGTYDVKWVFTPTDGDTYRAATGTLSVQIVPTEPTYTAPTLKTGLVYTGEAQDLADPGTATGGKMFYGFSVNGSFAETVPTGKDTVTYTVWYFVSGDQNHTNIGPIQAGKVTIAKADPTCAAPTGVTAVYGQKLSNLTLTNPSGNTPGEWTWTDGTKSVGNVGENTFTAKFTPSDQLNYNSKEGVTITVTVTKAASTVSTAPTAKTLTYNGEAQTLVNGGTTADGKLVYSLSETGEYGEVIPTGTKAGNYIVWYKVKGDDNHNDSTPASVSVTISKAQVTVTAKDKSAYVGSTAPDLSKPELDKDYTVSGLFGEDKLPATPTLKYVNAAGEKIIPDMTKTGEVLIRADGEQSDNYVIVYVAGKLNITTRPSSGGSSGSTTPSTPTKTEVTTNPDGSIKITPPKNSGKTKVEIPVKDVTPGTVAIIVKPDGTEEIVKDALPTKNGLELTVDGSVTVKIVDNAKEFADTKGHWAEDAIDFVSARGLVNGMTETTFAPNAPTTRAQLWTILARQADADLTGGSTWYEKAQAWAKASGISDGSDPNGNITRAQMVTMLWRAAGSLVVSGSSSFTDVPGDSYYAQAVAWAAEKGITTGVAEGKFDPNGTCTRAQIATFLYRTYTIG